MRTGKRRRQETKEELLELLRLGGLALELDGFMWLRVVLSSIRTHLPGRLGALALVLAIALRFLPFLGAAVCGVEPVPVGSVRTPVARVRVEPVQLPADHPDAREPGPRLAQEGDRPAPALPGPRSRSAFGATRWPEAIVPKPVRLPRPADRTAV